MEVVRVGQKSQVWRRIAARNGSQSLDTDESPRTKCHSVWTLQDRSCELPEAPAKRAPTMHRALLDRLADGEPHASTDRAEEPFSRGSRSG